MCRGGALQRSHWNILATQRFVGSARLYCVANSLAKVVFTRCARTVAFTHEYMTWLAEWYTKTAKTLKNGEGSIGFFQIGGGIAGDFPICVVPMLHQDLQRTGVPLWGYFAQISDSTTSYGSYSGAVPNEKITWGKLAGSTPKFIVESDATIVAPLIFNWVLGN